MLQFKSPTLLCNEKKWGHIQQLMTSTLDKQIMLNKYFYINKVYFPLGTSFETDAFNQLVENEMETKLCIQGNKTKGHCPTVYR